MPRKDDDDLIEKPVTAPAPLPVPEIQPKEEEEKYQVITENQLLNFKLDRILEDLATIIKLANQ